MPRSPWSIRLFGFSILLFSAGATPGLSDSGRDPILTEKTDANRPEKVFVSVKKQLREFFLVSTNLQPSDFPEKQCAALTAFLPTQTSLVSVSEGCFIQSYVFSQRLRRSGAFDEVFLYNVSLEAHAGGVRSHTLVLMSFGRRWTAYEMQFGLLPLPKAKNLQSAQMEVDRVILRKVRALGGRSELVKAYKQMRTVRPETALQEAYRLVSSQTSLVRIDKAGSKTGVMVFITDTGLMGMYEPDNGTAWGACSETTLPSEEWVNQFLTSSAGFKGLRPIRS